MRFSLLYKMTKFWGNYEDALFGGLAESAAESELLVMHNPEISFSERAITVPFAQVRTIPCPGACTDEYCFNRAIAMSTGEVILFCFGVAEEKVALNCLREIIATFPKTGEEIRCTADGCVVAAGRQFLIENGMYARVMDEIATAVAPDYGNRSADAQVVLQPGNDTYEDDAGNDRENQEVAKHIVCGKECAISEDVVITLETGQIQFGDRCVVDRGTVLNAEGGIYLGDDVVVEPFCRLSTIVNSYERFDVPISQQMSAGKGIYLMGDNLIGTHTVIDDDVTIGKGTVVEPHSWVRHSLPMGVVAGGVPAKVLRNRFSESWEFHQRERAVQEGMPDDILAYVNGRGKLITELVKQGDSVLDLGCGEGLLTAMIASKALDVFGCDYCEDAINEALQMYPDIPFIQANVTALPYDDESFDKVIFTEVAEHLMPVQLEHSLAEIVRVLRNTGLLLMTTPLTGNGTDTRNYSHLYEYSRTEMDSLLHRYFREVKLLHQGYSLIAAAVKVE